MRRTDPVTVEVCVPSLAGARAAERAGADRLELCAALTLGGLTPGAGLVAEVLRAVSIPVIALVRPREGGFRYHADEVATMAAEIERLRDEGVAGFAIGALTADGDLDLAALARLRDAARGAELCLHRAFDVVRDPAAALERAVELGFARILTSGGAPSAPEGAEAIAARVRGAGGRIEVMPGGGVTAENAVALLARTGARSLHLSASRWVPGAAAAGSSEAHLETDGARVAALRRALGAGPPGNSTSVLSRKLAEDVVRRTPGTEHQVLCDPHPGPPPLGEGGLGGVPRTSGTGH